MHLLALVLFAVGLLVPTLASAEPSRRIAPALARSTARAHAGAALDSLMAALPRDIAARLAGTYVAIDADETDPYAMIACDDDGDHVIVLSEAMLELVGHVAEAVSGDESSTRLASYAGALARQPRGARLVPPPPGFYEGPHDEARESAATDEALRGLLGHELARLARGHLVCAHPTAPRETGDAVWTPEERAFAFRLAPVLYDPRRLADAEATAAPSATGEGYRALLRLMGQVAGSTPSPTFSFLRFHPTPTGSATGTKPPR